MHTHPRYAQLQHTCDQLLVITFRLAGGTVGWHWAGRRLGGQAGVSLKQGPCLHEMVHGILGLPEHNRREGLAVWVPSGVARVWVQNKQLGPPCVACCRLPVGHDKCAASKTSLNIAQPNRADFEKGSYPIFPICVLTRRRH